MNAKLQRLWLSADFALGALFIDGKAKHFTLEDAVRQMAGYPVAHWKVQNQTAIPSGRYRLKIDMSTRFKKLTPHVLDVPGFQGIRIHAGNTAEDTEGCILLGNTCDLDGFIGRSRPALVEFFGALEAALMLGEECWLEVVNP